MPTDPILVTRSGFDKLQKKLERAIRRANKKCAERVLEEMKEILSLTDHTPEELRALGHPYRKGAPPNTPHEDPGVHIQDGDLIAGLSLEGGAGGSIISDGIVSTADHTMHVLFGTRTMRPRDFVTEAMNRTEEERALLLNEAIRQVLSQIE